LSYELKTTSVQNQLKIEISRSHP